MAHRDDVKTSTLFLFGFLTTIVVVIIILALMVLYQHAAARLEYERRISPPNVALNDALADQQILLVEYRKTGVLEQDGEMVGVYRIPIDRAQEIILQEWKTGVRPRPLPDTDDPPKAPDPAAPEQVTESDPPAQDAPAGEGDEKAKEKQAEDDAATAAKPSSEADEAESAGAKETESGSTDAAEDIEKESSDGA
jgi:type IV secretory pathway VirB10-like protein